MTVAFDLDRMLESVLAEDGPAVAPDAMVDRALTASAHLRQRRPIVTALDPRAWPTHRTTNLSQMDRWLILLVAMVVAAIIGTALLVGSLRTSPVLPTSSRLAVMSDLESHCMSVDRISLTGGGPYRPVDCASWASVAANGTLAEDQRLDASGTTAILAVVDLRTGERREVTRSTNRGMVPGAISPNGRYASWAWCTSLTRECDIGGTAVADLATTPPRIVDLPSPTLTLQIQWSPDSAWLAFETNNGTFVAHGDGSGPVSIGGRELADGGVLGWSPDSTELALKADQGLRIVQRDGSRPRWASTVDTYFASGSWSPDGRSIALAADGPLAISLSDTRPAELWIVQADGTAQRRIDVGPGCTATSASPEPWATPVLDCRGVLAPMSGGPVIWSPDGRRLVTELSQVGSEDPEPVAVALVDAETGSVTRIDGAGAPAWSPDGTQLAVATTAGIDVLAADGSGRHRVIDLAGPVTSKSGIWIPDDRP